MKKWVLALSVSLLASVLLAGDFWEKPFEEWGQGDVNKMLNDSPWAEQYVRTRKIGGKGSGVGGEKELYDTVTVRFFSALPVRHAYYRLLQIVNNYSKMDPEQKQLFESKFSRILHIDFSQQIIVAMEFASNDREMGQRFDRSIKITTAELMKQNATLISDRLGRIPITGYYPPSPDGTGAKFVFPREVDGQPLVSEEDKEIKIELFLPEVGRVFVTKKVKDLIYNGKIEI